MNEIIHEIFVKSMLGFPSPWKKLKIGFQDEVKERSLFIFEKITPKRYIFGFL